ncbi:hypothetical protein HPB52_024354 [Rhipicephalus sanguineus]|uniref:Uncharacterized protein n=1 Tax=Rhipicephalus sanguineus TaxID=34632 RepID=A0A9D4SMQ9_RHISA|nr:hypothetical protein HPB52_024354 [Rhipicephalus sanguineus]
MTSNITSFDHRLSVTALLTRGKLDQGQDGIKGLAACVLIPLPSGCILGRLGLNPPTTWCQKWDPRFLPFDMANKDAPVPALAAASLRGLAPQFEDYVFATGMHAAPDETRRRTRTNHIRDYGNFASRDRPDASQTSNSNVGEASKSGQGRQCHFCGHKVHIQLLKRSASDPWTSTPSRRWLGTGGAVEVSGQRCPLVLKVDSSDDVSVIPPVLATDAVARNFSDRRNILEASRHLLRGAVLEMQTNQ